MTGQHSNQTTHNKTNYKTPTNYEIYQKQNIEQYHQWVQLITSSHDDKYWDNMIQFAYYILQDLKIYKQHVVAERLNISGPRLSNITPLLNAIVERDKVNFNTEEV